MSGTSIIAKIFVPLNANERKYNDKYINTKNDTLNALPYVQVSCPFLVYSVFFFISTFSRDSFRITMRVANVMDQDQVRRLVGPGLDPNCLQWLSTDDTGRLRVNTTYIHVQLAILHCGLIFLSFLFKVLK